MLTKGFLQSREKLNVSKFNKDSAGDIKVSLRENKLITQSNIDLNFFEEIPVDVVVEDIKENGALIIDEPWIELILSGVKTWEMRASRFKKTGYIGLIKKGSKCITGIAKVEGYSDKLSVEELKRFENKHCVPYSQYTAASYKWFYAMKLTDVVRLSQPVAYEHKNGSVIWVKLSDQSDVVDKIRTELDKIISKNSNQKSKKTRAKAILLKTPIFNATQSKIWFKALKDTNSDIRSKTGMVPICKNGHVFSKNNGMRDGLYHLKNESNEFRFENFQDAVSAMKRDETLKWAYFTPDGKRIWKETAKWQKRSE